MNSSNSGKYTRKVVVLCLLMLAILTVMVTRMAYLQLVVGEEVSENIQTTSTRKYDEVTSRGEIKDRNGVTLVADVACYTVIFDYYEWQKQGQNDVILRLCEMLKASNLEWTNELPITDEVPYSYTYASKESGSGLRLMRFLKSREWEEDIPASRLFALLCERYGVDEELTSEQKRMVIGVRYYLEIYEFSAYNSPLIFAPEVDIDTVATISALSGELPGVKIDIGATREYFTDYASHVLGRVAAISQSEYADKKDEGYALTDSIGKDGIEQAFESNLRGVDGVKEIVIDKLTGKIVDEYYSKQPDPGDNVTLTIDIGLQQVAEESLAKTIENIKNGGNKGKGLDIEGGSVVVLSAKTGEILAMANYPTYSLITFSADFKENNSNTLKPFLNRAIAGLYAPGSTFKMVTALAALEESIVTPTYKMHTKGIYEFYAPSYTPACWYYNDYGLNHGDINVSQALAYSCNYFFYEVSRLMGIDKLNYYASILGLGQKTGIEISGEKAGNLAGPESRAQSGKTWYAAETIQAAIGQSEQQFTPLQIASYVATVVNGGTKYTPHLLKQITDYTNSQVVQEEKITSQQYEFSASSIKAIKEGMRGVVTEDGTASSVFKNFPIEVGGKTGSAQTTKGRSAHGVFVSFAPYDDPEIVVCVVGEYAGSGGSVAPICVDIYDHYFNLGLNTPEEPDAEQ